MTQINVEYNNLGTHTIRTTNIDLTKEYTSNHYRDFFVEDVEAFIKEHNLGITELTYILSFDVLSKIETLKDKYIMLLKNFITHNPDKFIIARIGYDNTIENKKVLDKLKKELVERYVALIEVGFVNVTSLSGLEFSQTFVYKNDASKEFLEKFTRREALTFISEI
jgi:hypothetical protein